ncbi:MAG: molybdopterin-guanine dinucleotide biosynthesis protein MobB [Clostridia bacterium]|nr:molybdopterin-guanine dinucleotide biosynthesis protein MobB [Clostridia bacterium]
MKIFVVTGIRQSGKTTTIERLLAAMGQRGLKAGTVKTVFCPSFSMDQRGSNTDRHRRAGAQLVCARGKRETAFIYPRAMTNAQILSHYEGYDYVILEGDYTAPVPRLCAGHEEADVKERINAHTLCVVGRAAAGRDQVLGLPAFDPLTQAESLLNFLEKTVPDTTPDALAEALAVVPGVSDGSFCQHHCTHHLNQVEVRINGQSLTLTPQQKEILLGWFKEA